MLRTCARLDSAALVHPKHSRSKVESELLQARFLCGLAHLDDNTHNKLNIRFSCLQNLKASLLLRFHRASSGF